MSITIENPEKYVAGLYERLSNEKIEIGNGEVINKDERESGSISNQKAFLEDFCKGNNIHIHDHYTDDGYTGANFDRPDFKRLIKDIENGIINLVIVKDLSRFGRTSKVTDYLSEYFPEKGVRFIAVADNEDTGNIETTGDMAIFKTTFNEYFLRDTSRKVRTGKRTRAKQGKVMAVYPTYGYKKDEKDKNHYIVDPITAPIVKKIFALAKEGKTPTEIGKVLTDENISVPSEIVGNNHTRKGASEIKRGWNRNTVKRILQNVTYLGWVSNGNTQKVSYKSKRTIIIPKEDRIIVKGMHEPLVDKETFDLVQDMIESRTSTRVKTHDWLLKGLVCCKECGKKLSVVPQKKKTKTTYYLRCNTYATNTQLNLCTPHSNNLEKVTDIVIEQIRQKCRQYLDENKYNQIANNSKGKIMQDRFNIKGEILILEKQLKDTNRYIDKIYEDKLNGKMEEQDFERNYVKFVEQRKSAEKRIKELKESQEEKPIDIDKLVKEFVEMKEVTRKMLVSLVDKIEISQDKEITIYYKFSSLNIMAVAEDNIDDLVNVG